MDEQILTTVFSSKLASLTLSASLPSLENGKPVKNHLEEHGCDLEGLNIRLNMKTHMFSRPTIQV
jgi:hypothetical protein